MKGWAIRSIHDGRNGESCFLKNKERNSAGRYQWTYKGLNSINNARFDTVHDANKFIAESVFVNGYSLNGCFPEEI